MSNRSTSPIYLHHTTSTPSSPLFAPPSTATSQSTTQTVHASSHNSTMQTQYRFPRRLSDFWLKTITPRSRRRRRKDECPLPGHAVHHPISVTASPASQRVVCKHKSHSQRPASSVHSCCALIQHSSTLLAYATTLLLLLTTCSFGAASPCDSHSWWDPVRDKCIPCTVCQGEMIPLRPCQLHRDTICGSIYDLKIDWVVLAKTEPNWKERRKDELNYNMEQHLKHEELQQLHDETMPMDWQTAALFVAVLACLLFFIAAACILVHHMRQWRRMERRLDQDVEELSTKLMAKLAEVQSLEGGTFFIGNADALRVPTTFQPQHVLLPAEKSGKHNDRRILKTLQPGNIYIEESSSKG